MKMIFSIILNLTIAPTEPASSAQPNLGVAIICINQSFSMLIRALNKFNIKSQIIGVK